MRSRLLPLLVACVTGSACSFVHDFDSFSFDGGDGGGDGGGQLDTTPPEVTSSSPTGTLLDGRTPVRVTFDEPISAAPGDVTVLLDTVQDIAGTVTVEGSTVVFTPSTPLAQFGSYAVTVGTGVTDLAGNALAAEHTFSFVVPVDGNDGLASRRLDTEGTGDPTCPQVAMDANGNAMVLFARGTSLYTAYYRAGVGFEPTALLATGSEATLGMSPGGRSAVAYTATVGGDPTVLVRLTGLANGTFGAPEATDDGTTETLAEVSTCDLSHGGKSIAVNDDGDAVVAWRTYRPTAGDPVVGFYRNVRSDAGTWGTPAWDGTYPFNTEHQSMGTAIDADGNARLVVASSTISTQYIRHDFAAGGSWTETTAGSFGITTAPRIAIDPEGDFVFGLALTDGGGSNPEIQVSSVDAAGTATRAELSANIGTAATDVHLSVANGIWATWMSAGNIGIARFADGDIVWLDHPTLVTAASEPGAQFPMIAGRGASREAIVMWERAGAVRWTGVLLDDLGLPTSGARQTFPIAGTAGSSPRIVYDAPSGHGLVVWVETQVGNELHATQFHNFPPHL